MQRTEAHLKNYNHQRLPAALFTASAWQSGQGAWIWGSRHTQLEMNSFQDVPKATWLTVLLGKAAPVTIYRCAKRRRVEKNKVTSRKPWSNTHSTWISFVWDLRLPTGLGTIGALLRVGWIKFAKPASAVNLYKQKYSLKAPAGYASVHLPSRQAVLDLLTVSWWLTRYASIVILPP